MSLIEVRKRALSVETTFHEGGPAPAQPLRIASACAVIRNPYAGRHEPDLQDAPRPREILFALGMGTGGRVHARLGGLTTAQVSVHDGQR